MREEFVLRLLATEHSPSQLATSRHRVILNVAVFRQHNMIAGEAIRVTASDSVNNGSFHVGPAWPSMDLAPECLYNSALHSCNRRSKGQRWGSSQGR
ncbi:hypothetical protein CPB86DRAFT_355686 [Serendipita vermifera]|nr:hypothetical protein CPB86DRAFT_355686 [Serendipita vermifera]